MRGASISVTQSFIGKPSGEGGVYPEYDPNWHAVEEEEEDFRK
jgi:hypothetical protein